MNQEQYNAMLTENQIAQDNYANMKAEIDRINQVAALYQQATPEKQNALRWQMTQLLDRYTQLRAGLNDASNRLAQSQANINAYNNEIARQQELANQQSNTWQKRRTFRNPDTINVPNNGWVYIEDWAFTDLWNNNTWYYTPVPAQTNNVNLRNNISNPYIPSINNNLNYSPVSSNFLPKPGTTRTRINANTWGINTWTNEKYPVSDAYKNASWINQQVNPKFRTDRTNAYKNRWGL